MAHTIEGKEFTYIQQIYQSHFTVDDLKQNISDTNYHIINAEDHIGKYILTDY